MNDGRYLKLDLVNRGHFNVRVQHVRGIRPDRKRGRAVVLYRTGQHGAGRKSDSQGRTAGGPTPGIQKVLVHGEAAVLRKKLKRLLAAG